MHNQHTKISNAKSYNCIFTYSQESVKITLLEFFSTHTLQLHLLLAVNNIVQHYKLPTHSDLAFYSNWSNLNSCKPELILWLFPRYSSPNFLPWCHRLFFGALNATGCLLFKCSLKQEKVNAVSRLQETMVLWTLVEVALKHSR